MFQGFHNPHLIATEIPKYLVDIIRQTLKKKQNKVKNSRSFVLQAQTWKAEPDKKQVLYDITNLYLSIPADKGIDVILQQVSGDYESRRTRIKLTLIDSQQLTEFYVSECFFLRTMILGFT